MPNDTGSGWSGALAMAGSAIATSIAAGVAMWLRLADGRRERAAQNAADSVRKTLDEHQRDYLDRLEREIDALKRDRDFWESKAREGNAYSRERRHELNNYLTIDGKPAAPPVPTLPPTTDKTTP